MDERKKNLSFLLILVILLLLAVAAFYAVTTRKETSGLSPKYAQTSGSYIPHQRQEGLKTQPNPEWEEEFLSPRAAPAPRPGHTGSGIQGRNRFSPGAVSKTTELQDPSAYQPAAQTLTPSYAASTASTLAGRRTPAAAYPPNGRSLAPVSNTPKEKEALPLPFAPYMTALTKEQADQLNKQLNGLSDRIEAAILRAMQPKSKKNRNIEKYLSSPAGEEPSSAQAAGPFAEVARQINRQKNNIVSSIQQAFGSQAAGQAGQIMDNYQKDIMNALNQPGATAEQIQQQTRQISQKYNKQLQKLSQKNGLERMKQERQTRDTRLQQGLEKSYGSEMAGQLGEIMAAYSQKDLALAQQPNLTQEEYYQQLLANKQALHKEMVDTLVKNGQSPQGLINLENKQEREDIEKFKKAEEEGKRLPVVYEETPEKKEEREKDNLRKAKEMYGAEFETRVKNIYQRHDEEAEKIKNDEELSVGEKLEQLNQIGRKYDQELLVESSLAEILKNSQATQQQKKEFEQHARPVLSRMYEQIDKVREQNLPPDQEERQIRLIQEQAQRELSQSY